MYLFFFLFGFFYQHKNPPTIIISCAMPCVKIMTNLKHILHEEGTWLLAFVVYFSTAI
jgi:hypothetical protein